MSKLDDNVFREAGRWAKTNGWWIHSIIIVAILALLLNTGQYRNYDTIGLALTTLEVFLIMAAFVGFWLIRREAISEARETAERVTQELINKRFQQDDPVVKSSGRASGSTAPAVPPVEGKQEEGDL